MPLTTEVTLKLDSGGSTPSITLREEDYVEAFTLNVVSGTLTYLGSGTFQGRQAEALTFTAGTVYTTCSRGPNAPLGGITITAVGGVTNLTIKK